MCKTTLSAKRANHYSQGTVTLGVWSNPATESCSLNNCSLLVGNDYYHSATTVTIIINCTDNSSVPLWLKWPAAASKMLLVVDLLYFQSRDEKQRFFNSSSSCYSSLLCFNHTHTGTGTPTPTHRRMGRMKSPSKHSFRGHCWAAASQILVLGVLWLPVLHRRSSIRDFDIQYA